MTATRTLRLRQTPPGKERGIEDGLLDPGLPHGGAKPEPAGPADDISSRGRSALELARPFFTGKRTRGRAVGFTALLGVLLTVESGMILYFSEVQKHFMTALQEKNGDAFYHGIVRTASIIAFLSPVIALHEYVAGLLQMDWRADMTSRFVRRYLSSAAGSNMFYRLHITGELDNPDQRILQDVHDFVETTFTLVQEFAGTVFRIFGFAGVLYAISRTACLGVLAYATLGTGISVLGFGTWIVAYKHRMVKQEADLRYCLIRTRENAESIAFFRGGEAELAHFSHAFQACLATVSASIFVHTGYSVFNRTFHWATFAVPSLLVGPAYLRGEVPFGSITQAGMAFQTILGGLTFIMNKMDMLSGWGVRITRLESLLSALMREELRMCSDKEGRARILSAELPASEPLVMQLCDVTLRTPPRGGVLQKTVVERLSFRLGSGQSLLIVGASGIGKSSLLRAIAGLWSDGEGRIGLVEAGALFFMPQKPYMSMGTLREQLLYPNIQRGDISNADCKAALARVNLEYLLESHTMDDCKDWAALLSLGEQQRVNFARVLLQSRLRLALIDEGTSACDPENEAHLYSLLQQHLQSYASVGHRASLQRFHSHVLWLQRPDPAGGNSPQDRHRGLAPVPAACHISSAANCSFLPMAEFQVASQPAGQPHAGCLWE